MATISSSGEIESLLFSPDGVHLATLESDRSKMRAGFSVGEYTIRIWDVKKRTLVKQFATEPWTGNLFFSSDGKSLFAAVEDAKRRTVLKQWDVRTGVTIRNYGFAWSGIFLNRGKHIAALSSPIRIYSTQNGKLLRTIPITNGGYGDIRITHGGKYLVCLTFKKDPYTTRCQVWDVATGKLVRVMPESNVQGLCLSQDGRYMAYALNIHNTKGLLQDAPMRIYEVATGKLIQEIKSVKAPRNFGAHFSSDSQYLICGGPVADKIKGHAVGGHIGMYSARTGLAVWEHALDYYVTSAYFMIDAKTTVSMGDGNTSRSKGRLDFWEAKTGRYLRTIWGRSARTPSLSWSSDGQLLAVGSDNKIDLYDTKSIY